MRDFINDLTGGFFRRRIEPDIPLENNENTEDENIGGQYDVYMQFDEDKPIKLFSDVDNMDSVQFEIYSDSTDDDEIYFVCPKSGKTFKIFSKSKKKK